MAPPLAEIEVIVGHREELWRLEPEGNASIAVQISSERLNEFEDLAASFLELELVCRAVKSSPCEATLR